MPNQDLINYINQAKAEGMSDQKIKEDLSKVGWAQTDIDEAFGTKSNVISNAPNLNPAAPQKTSITKIAIKTHYYITKIISIIGIFFSGYLIYMFGYSTYVLVAFEKNFNTIVSAEELNHYNSIIGWGALVAIVGIIGLIGSIGLFYLKKWGIILIYIFVVLLWATSWMIVGGISENWLGLLIFSLIFIYLIWQRKFILNYRKDIVVKSDS